MAGKRNTCQRRPIPYRIMERAASASLLFTVLFVLFWPGVLAVLHSRNGSLVA